MKIVVRYDAPLLEYLYEALAPQSRTKTKGLLVSGRVAVNGRAVKAYDLALHAGDSVEVLREPARVELPSDRRLKVVYEDEWLVVAEKAAGIPTVSAPGYEGPTAYSILTAMVRERGRRGDERVFIVHRLDRDTSGLLVFARDERTKRALQDNWNESVSERRYVAVAEGRFENASGRIDCWLKEHPKSLKMSCSPVDNGGQRAVTDFDVKASDGHLSLVELHLHTGRKNQIRVQLSWIGHPVAGDRKYGAQTDPFGRLALHAAGISFVHPVTGRRMAFSSRVPFGNWPSF